jgi:nitronate monooxygenase
MSPVDLRTPLCDLVGIRVPIMLAGMAGGPGTPEVVAAVTNAGGLGVFGASGMTCAAIERAVARARELTDGPFGVNAQLAAPTPATGERERILEVMRPFRRELGLPDEPPEPAKPDSPVALIEAALAGGATVVTTFDDPAPIAEAARAAGARLLPMVTTVDEAVSAVASGADGVIAQGREAGGHRGSFSGGDPTAGGGTISLVPQVADAVGPAVPVVASGGIMDGRGIAAALALGAAGVSLGTRFLASAESNVAEAYVTTLHETRAEQTVVTDVITGRPARWVRNRLLDALVEAGAGTLGWGRQAPLIADLRRAAAEQGRADLLPMLAGEGAALSGGREPAAAIMARLERETELALAGLAARATN